MEHVVFFPAPDGSSAFRRLPSLAEAVRFVEHLRNVEGVGEVSVHALTAVPLSFRAWYRVEVPTPAAPDPAGAAPVELRVVPEQAGAPAEAPAAPVAAAQAPRHQAAGVTAVPEPTHSLGFFA